MIRAKNAGAQERPEEGEFMDTSTANTKILSRLMFRLLLIQIILAAVGAVNGIVSSFFASNYVGIEAMSAIGLYYPIGMLLSAICTILLGGTAILCGKYMGRISRASCRMCSP